MIADYQKFIDGKFQRMPDSGFTVKRESLNKMLMPFQADIVEYACKRGRFGGFEDCGLGKSFQQLEICRQIVMFTNKKALIFAPLAVAQQFEREAEKFQIDVDVTVCKSQKDVKPGINITNYERMSKFDPSEFVCVMLDEGSILKSVAGKIRTAFLTEWNRVKYPMSWTATPAPNDFMELGNQSQFCQVLSREEMLATFFVHDGGDTAKWRLKGHAESEFWKWLASWCVMLRSPADLGYDDSGYDLPPLKYHEHVITTSNPQEGRLFAVEASSLAERRDARKTTIDERIAKAAELANNSDEPWVIWCNYNEEGERLEKLIPDAVEVAGRHKIDEKEERLNAFTNGEIRVLVTKPKIGGFGLNWQHCPNTAILPTDSYEMWYQMIRRFWRFGQTQTVNVHAILSDLEGAVIANVKRKEEDASRMFDELVQHMKELSTENVRGVKSQIETYHATERMEIPSWLVG
jgi:hypothetical protein